MQQRAVEAKRDLTEDELRSVKEQSAKAQGLFTQIQDLTEIELRNSKVSQMAAQVQAAITGSDGSGPNIEPDIGLRANSGATGTTKLGGATTQARDPGHYRSVKAG